MVHFRGYCGRLDAKAARLEIAEFIALMREQEAADDEEEYWLTHPVARFRRKLWSKLRGVDVRAAAAAVRTRRCNAVAR